MKQNTTILRILGCLSLCMLCAACQNTQRDRTETEETDYTAVSVAFWDMGMGTAYDDALSVLLAEKLALRLSPVQITPNDAAQKMDIWAATGSFPDIFVGAYRQTTAFRDWAERDLIQALPEDLTAYPNLSAHLAHDAAQSCKIDGQLFCIYRQGDHYQHAIGQTILYRADLAKQIGWRGEPTDWQDFRKLIRTIIREDPLGNRMQGMTASSVPALARLLFAYSNPLAAIEGEGFAWVTGQNGQLIPAYFAGRTFGEAMLPVWSLARLLYEEGTIASDIAFTSHTQAINRFIGDEAAALCVNTSYTRFAMEYGALWEAQHDTRFADSVNALPLVPSMTNAIYVPPEESSWDELYISGRVDLEKRDKILAMVDFLLSEEALRQVNPSDAAIADTAFSLLSLVRDWTKPAIGAVSAEDTKRLDTAIDLPESDALGKALCMKINRQFNLTPYEDMMDIMTGSAPVEAMWEARISAYKAEGADQLIRNVNREVKLYQMNH